MSSFAANELERLEQAQLRRVLAPVSVRGKHITIDGRKLLNLASNDYLGLSQHPALIEAAIQATREHGVGSGSSRLVSGTQPFHEEVEQRFAAFKHAESALLMATGYTANLAVLTTLAGPGDLIVMDKLVHASLIDAARASGAEVRTYPHLNDARAAMLLKKQTSGRRLLVSDSVFSMDGNCADLPVLSTLADMYDATLVIDEAHGTGVLGSDGSGLAAEQGVTECIYNCGAGGVIISTASKALGSLGGIVTASKPVIDLLINKARPFIYSTAVPPAQAAAIDAAVKQVQANPAPREHLVDLWSQLRVSLDMLGWDVVMDSDPSPITPLIVGSEQAALDLAARLRHQGFFAPAIRPPTVAPGASRVRLSLRADMTTDDIDQLVACIGAPPA